MQLGSLKDVEGLRKVIFSADMYKNPVLYKKWVSGMETGNLKGMKPSKAAPIGNLITAAHEAHMRLEVWLASSKRNFKHTPGIVDAADKRRQWKKMARLVMEDRANNAADAHALRVQDMPDYNVVDTEGAESDGSLGEEFYT